MRKVTLQRGWHTRTDVSEAGSPGSVQVSWSPAPRATAHAVSTIIGEGTRFIAPRLTCTTSTTTPVLVFEGRPQLYGTQLEPDDEGRLQPYPIEDAERIEERRRARVDWRS